MVRDPAIEEESNVIPFEKRPKGIIKPDVKEPPTSNWWLGNVKEGNAVWVSKNNDPSPFAPVFQVLKHLDGELTLLQDGMNPQERPQWFITSKFSRLFSKVKEIEAIPSDPDEQGLQPEETTNGNSDTNPPGVVANPEDAPA